MRFEYGIVDERIKQYTAQHYIGNNWTKDAMIAHIQQKRIVIAAANTLHKLKRLV